MNMCPAEFAGSGKTRIALYSLTERCCAMVSPRDLLCMQTCMCQPIHSSEGSVLYMH